MSSNYLNTAFGRAIAIGISGAQQGSTVQLNTNYVYNTSGTVCPWRFIAPYTSDLTDFYFFISAVAGTAGTATIEIRDDNGSKPGTTVLATQSITWDSTANRWNRVTFSTPASLTRNTIYWVIVTNAAGTPASNNFTLGTFITQGNGTAPPGINSTNSPARSYSSTNGFSTNPTAGTGSPIFVMKFSNGSVWGNNLTKSASYTSNTLERGLKIDQLPFDVGINGLQYGLAGASFTGLNGLKIYKGTTAPGGTTLLTLTGISTVLGTAMFDEIILTRNTVYRVVLTFGSAGTFPTYLECTDRARFADVQGCDLYGGRIYDTIDNNAGGWTDNVDRFSGLSLLVSRILSGGNSWSA